MRSPEQDKERIKHILEAIENILNFTSEHTSEEFMSVFLHDENRHFGIHTLLI
jgi:uncharacterized protein with HEPN domain